MPLLDIQAAVDELSQEGSGAGGVLGGAFPRAERELVPLVAIPSATMLVEPGRSIPSSIITAKRRSDRGRFSNRHH